MTMPPTQGDFQPPTPERVHAHLERYPAQGPSRLMAWLPISALVAVVLLMLADNTGWLTLAPWVILMSVFALMGFRVRRFRDLEGQVTHVQELSTLRHWRQALRLAWSLLPKLGAVPEMHSRIVALMAHNLDQLKVYDAAIVAFDHLIDHLPQEHPGSVHLRLQRTFAQLATDRLADADESLRRLRGAIDSSSRATAAAYHLACLFQQVCTHHWADAAQRGDKLLEQLRPLGVDAAYGHAMMALSFHHLDPQQYPGAAEGVALWWSRATLLLPSDSLVDRLTELAPLLESEPVSARQDK